MTVLSLTWESPYLGKTILILRRGPGIYRFVYIIMMVADALVPDNGQATSNHHAASVVAALPY